ncbi:hypothetical protein E4P41_01525 [Geodermatophilus sp. DF01-2]|uniref:hypothetical protein n=1 Tax=Geodermatophilus sp. DF01-2 TaxID=2559610 RepID=UPI001073C0F5|nr:hypothetical protein [Geodermatophilus sp. DF01_2]TFV64574.1 hypothetical protein E4P41_01525 [Geodermatophilus sp. DF01_2]
MRTARLLDAEQVEELLARYRAAATVFKLGGHFGIDRRTVGAILKRKGIQTRGPGGRWKAISIPPT